MDYLHSVVRIITNMNIIHTISRSIKYNTRGNNYPLPYPLQRFTVHKPIHAWITYRTTTTIHCACICVMVR